MKRAIKNIVKKTAAKLGYEIRKIPKIPYDNFEWLRAKTKFKWMQNFNVNTILDIGANTGDFALGIREFFPNANIYSFEPLKDVCANLSKNMSQVEINKSSNWKAFNIALGDFNGSTKIKRSERSTNSSLLEMTEFFKGAYNYIRVDSWEEEISIRKLDDFIKEKKLEIVPELMIKMDVEGYEEKVIRGGEEIIKKAKIIFTEVTFKNERYKGQILFDGLYMILKEMGYRCQGFYNMAYEPKTGITLYADAVFVRD